ncbi:MAG: hypothetical protein WAN66_02950 [Limnoraphis robusta]|uniref:DUF3784 domain-containing protein n=1 Tax=Limnoraphis robusta TaxID=1118279 RepID=UPI002B209C48|nr:hypothetical protein [Limnoraphis robusta]MEA5497948.1 hypothetical protein [Limnoraphis robusta BA-68 BA1]MEA5542090.1 hypothetical protein [Limnoraphis robusta Tam1]
MSYTYRYLNPSEFARRNQEFLRTDDVRISTENAKKVGIICLRAIQIYQETQNNIGREKSNLRIWVRGQRNSARNHGRLIRYKGASRTRSSINASISNINDQVLNNIDSMLNIIDSNMDLAKQRMRKCLDYTTMSDIKSYEVTYIEEQKQLKKHKSLKEIRIGLYISVVAIPIFAIAFVADATINLFLSILFVISLSVIWGIIAFYIIKYLTKRIEEFENAQSSIRDLKMNKTIEDQDSIDFLSKLNDESEDKAVEDDQESDTSEMCVINELAKKLREEYFILENACLNFDVDANNWMDLAEKIHKDLGETSDLHLNHAQSQPRSNENISDRYTVNDLKSRFSSFQEAKEFYGISAKGWQTLVDKLNNQ